jgi:hypothetical protein
MWYSINFQKTAWNYIPVVFRQLALVQLVYSVLRPLTNVHYSWRLYRESNMYKLSHNGQKCYLEKALNDSFDQELRRIYIDGSGGSATKTYIYTSAEDRPKYLGKIFLRQRLEFADSGADFTVHVPSTIVSTQNYQLRALIDFYKLGGKRYLIIETNE